MYDVLVFENSISTPNKKITNTLTFARIIFLILLSYSIFQILICKGNVEAMEEKYKYLCTIKHKNLSDDYESREVLYQNDFANSEVHLVSPKGQSNRYCAKVILS